MTISPDQLGVFMAAVGEPLPEGFANLEIYKECRNLLGHMIVTQAVNAHPSWERTGNGTLTRRRRTGPKTPETLKAWFERKYPERVEHMAEAIRRAVHVNHGLVPPETS